MIDFQKPQKLPVKALPIIVEKSVKTIFSQLWPLILVSFLNRRPSEEPGENYLIVTTIILAILSFAVQLLRYFSTTYYVLDDDLVMQKGILSKSKVVVPVDKIQNINLNETLFHRLINCSRLEVDTAGGADAEISFPAIRNEDAEALKELIFSLKSENTPLSTQEDESIPERETLITLDFKQLLVVGFSENHIRSGGIIVSFLMWIFYQLSDLGFDYRKEMEDLIFIETSAGYYLVVALFFIVLSLLVSVILTILKYANLEFFRENQTYKLKAGLFERRELAANQRRIQIVTWSSNPLQKLFDIWQLQIKQIGITRSNSARSFVVKGAHLDNVDRVLEDFASTNHHPDLAMYDMDSAYIARHSMIAAALLALVVVYLYFIPFDSLWGYGLVLIPLFYFIQSLLKYKKFAFGYDDEKIYIKKGIFGDTYSLCPLYKIQSISMDDTPYLRRKNLVDFVIHTAAGNLYLPFQPKERSIELYNHLLYAVESQDREWM